MGMAGCTAAEGKEVMIKEIDKSVKALVDANGGYCPCAIVKDENTKCMCREFREMPSGICHCGRFEKRAEE